MFSRLTLVDAGVWTVAGLFTRSECAGLIARAERIGFVAAAVLTANGPRMLSAVRNNDRVELHDPELARAMWTRIEGLLAPLDDGVPTGVDARLRFYRYVPGQRFKRHRDGAVVNDAGETSKLSYLVYLNDDCVGGETAFREPPAADVTSPPPADFVVTPQAGTALLFRHERWHEGTPVVSGVKYVLRSDIFYRPRS